MSTSWIHPTQAVTVRRWTRVLRAGIGIACLPAGLRAQTKPEVRPEVSSPKKDDIPVVLNPFVISTTQDFGYLAQNSLSGSRLNTNIGDLATPTTAFTQEFLSDIAITNVDDLAQYMVNTKTDYPEGDNLFKDADSQRFQIRGLPAYNYSVNFFQTNLRLDTFSTERVEQSRGPNSILFGLGSPGGVVNVSTKRAVYDRNFGSISLQGRSPDGWRAALDYNQALLPGKLSARIAAVQDEKDTWRAREFDHQRRLFLTGAWQVTSKTRLDAEGEHGLVHKSLVQPMVANDAYTPWLRAGRRLSDTANAAAGIKVISTADWNAIDTSTGRLWNWRNKTESVNNNVVAQAWLTDFTVLPKDVVLNAGPGFYQDTNYSRGSLILTHAFSRDFNIELAGYAARSRHNAVAGRNAALLQADTSLTLPNGQPNPNAGRAFVDQFPGTADDYQGAERLRFSAAYTKNLGRWGRHQFAALYEKSWTRSQNTQLRPAITDNPYNTSDPANGANNLRFRTYFDLNGPRESIGAGDWRPYIVAAPGNIRAWENFNATRVTDAVTGRVMGVKWISNAVPGDNHFEQDSAMAILQSHFLNDRIVTVAGYRADWQDSWYSLTDAALARARPYGSFVLGEFASVPGAGAIRNTANNLTYSALVRVTRNVAVTYNHAANSSLPDANGFLVGNDASGHVPAPRGRSEDIGVKVTLGNRFSLNALYYETSAQKNTANSNPTIENRFPLIWAALDNAGVKGPDGSSALNVPSKFNRYTFDSSGKGYEFELIANPTDNWRVFLNASQGSVKQTNIGQEARDYVAKYKDYWIRAGGNLMVQGGLTVAQNVAAIEQEIQNLYIVTNGQQGRGQVPRQLNLVANYSFKAGPLKGYWIGGGTRYRSGEVVDVEIVRDPSGSTRTETTFAAPIPSSTARWDTADGFR
jgi:outer membrane receptor protein involved in Fe transport